MATVEDQLTVLLNKLVAICETCGRGSYADLARAIQKNPQQVTEWLTLRTHEPSGRVVMAMQTWAAKKTLLIARDREELGSRYRQNYENVCRKFPLSGGK